MSKATAPHGWSHAAIGELCRLINGRAFKPSDWTDTGLPIIRIQNLNNPDAKFNYFLGDVAPKFIVENGELLFAWSGTPGTSFGAHIWNGGRAILNQHIFRVLFNETVINKAFFQIAINQKLQELIDKAHGGVGLRHVTKGKFEHTEILLPPLNEQRRIVAKIEALRARSQQVKEALEAIPPLLEQFRQSVLAAAFRGDLTADWRKQDSGEFLEYNFPSTWKKEELGNVIEELKQGWSPKCENFPSLSDDIWGVIKTTAVQPLRFVEEENKQLPSHLEPRPELELLEGDLLITRAGPRARAGVTCLVSSVRPKLIICDKVYRLRVKESCVFPLYLAYFLNSVSIISLIDKLKTGISESGVNLTQEKFLAICLWLPPIAEQQEIVNRVKTLFTIADEIEQQYQQAKAYLDQLDQSILAKAFRGELVTQDPNDEPASILLERIRAEREKREAEAKAAKKSTSKTTKRRSKKAQQQSSNQLELPGLE